jgi:hypothetical protein
MHRVKAYCCPSGFAAPGSGMPFLLARFSARGESA